MILYTPLQLELVLEGFDKTKYPEYKEIQYKGVPVLVEGLDSGKQRIVKLLSTDLRLSQTGDGAGQLD